MKTFNLAILLLTAIALSACGSAANQTANSNSGKTENAKVGTGNTEIKKTEANKSAEVSKTANGNSETNKTSELPVCELTKAPVIKGFSLGQTVDEINAKYPFFKKAYEAEKQTGLEDNKKANFVLMTIASSFKEEETKDVESFKDVNLIWHFLDDKLMALVITYQDDETLKIGKVKTLIDKIAKEYNLPKEGWKFDRGNGATLTCQGFKADASNELQSGPSLMITDLVAEKELKKRGL